MDNLEVLERLGNIDPPDLGVSARVAAAIEGAIAGESGALVDIPLLSRAAPVTAPNAESTGSEQRTPFSVQLRRHRRAGVLVALIAALSVVLALVVTGLDQAHGPSSSAPPTTAPATHPNHGFQFQLIDSTSFPFRVLGGGANAVQLDCPTTSICYMSPNGSVPVNQQGRLEKSTDGGATWQPTAQLPGDSEGPMLTDSSCSSAEVCAVLAEGSATAVTDFAFTTDGGAQWNDVRVPLPRAMAGASLGAVSCVDASRCMVYVAAGSSGSNAPSFGTFLSTTDGGASWSTASSVPSTASGSIWELRCATDGSCLAITVPGSAAAPGDDDLSLEVLRSTDFGATWTVTPAPASIRPGPGVLLVSCGDTLHCLAAYPSATPGAAAIELASTSDGGATWNIAPAPASWGTIAVAVSCDASDDCWVSSSSYGVNKSGGTAVAQAGYSDPVVEVSHDGGATWSSIGVPAQFNGKPTAVVGPLSCPATAGCIGIGLNESAFSPPSTATGVAAIDHSRVVLSNAGGSANASS
jgi:photosystem II stability/assembly factor-like uncharacterized protein